MIPDQNAIVKGVVITFISLIVIGFAKPYMPDAVKKLVFPA